MDQRPVKRVKLSPDPDERVQSRIDPVSVRAKRVAFLSSISRSVSPPTTSRSVAGAPLPAAVTAIDSIPDITLRKPEQESDYAQATVVPPPVQTISSALKTPPTLTLIPSPFKLTKIRDLPASKNNDTISLNDILGNPLIKEAWIFNYCFDIDWFMGFFDSDVRDQVKVKVIHGSWKNDSPNKQAIDDACGRWRNVEAATAYLPDQFGTHHSKMFILFTHDDLVQVVIHTANMLQQDWTNLTQAAWVSPMLPLLNDVKTTVGKVGSGSRFKHDLLAYLAAYGSKTKDLRETLTKFDFRSIRAALIASVPTHMKDFMTTRKTEALWDQKLYGYPSLVRALASILPKAQKKSSSHVVCQVSSIATLPQKWLNTFMPVLYASSTSTNAEWDPSRVSLIYPTPANVAVSLNGYASGGSIHTKAQSSAHLKQIVSLRQSLCQWTKGPQENTRAGRDEAAPHIKTYVSFATKPTKEAPVQDIQWALLTSANLSQQAWGTVREIGKGKEKEKEVVVQSYEIGVLVWPELFAEDFDTGEDDHAGTLSRDGADCSVKMVPVFEKDVPSPSNLVLPDDRSSTTQTIVGVRLPYDLPLTPYKANDMPWSAQGTYPQPDRWGRSWV